MNKSDNKVATGNEWKQSVKIDVSDLERMPADQAESLLRNMNSAFKLRMKKENSAVRNQR
ncbi:hypothetical protein [Vibrio harveyi]|uniref:hypothetical protein n=1 Tax=Vibrio harveyi TaxID=669 RepID=UPI003D704109